MEAVEKRICGFRVRELRRALDWTTTTLSFRSNVSEAKLHAIEAGAIQATTAQLIRLARALSVTPEYLRGDEDDPPEGLEGNSLYRLFRAKLEAATPENRQRILVTLLQGVEMVNKKGWSS